MRRAELRRAELRRAVLWSAARLDAPFVSLAGRFVRVSDVAALGEATTGETMGWSEAITRPLAEASVQLLHRGRRTLPWREGGAAIREDWPGRTLVLREPARRLEAMAD